MRSTGVGRASPYPQKSFCAAREARGALPRPRLPPPPPPPPPPPALPALPPPPPPPERLPERDRLCRRLVLIASPLERARPTGRSRRLLVVAAAGAVGRGLGFEILGEHLVHPQTQG